MNIPAPRQQIEHEIAEAVARAGIRLRSDRVAMRVIASLKDGSALAPRALRAMIFTISAPIRQPTKATDALGSLVSTGPFDEDVEHAVYGNSVRLRCLRGVPTKASGVFGFVHNREVDPLVLLDVVELCLRQAR